MRFFENGANAQLVSQRRTVHLDSEHSWLEKERVYLQMLPPSQAKLANSFPPQVAQRSRYPSFLDDSLGLCNLTLVRQPFSFLCVGLKLKSCYVLLYITNTKLYKILSISIAVSNSFWFSFNIKVWQQRNPFSVSTDAT